LAASAQQDNPFCSHAGCSETRAWLKQTCDYILAGKATPAHDLCGWSLPGISKLLDDVGANSSELLRFLRRVFAIIAWPKMVRIADFRLPIADS
jgi:hypothetical protein